MEELGTSIESCPCGHVYHKSCIRHWIVQKRICPQCKGDALPLINLSFNLFHFSANDRKTTAVERLGTLQAELSAVSLSIDNELCEINALEPQLAEAQEEEAAYKKGITTRKNRKKKLEEEFEVAHMRFMALEERKNGLNDGLETIRGKINKALPEIPTDSATSLRPMQTGEISKLVSFALADFKKLAEIGKESISLGQSLTAFKSQSLELSKSLRAIEPSAITKAGHPRVEGFVPIDSFGHKRRREEGRLKELDNRRPEIFETTSRDYMDTLSNLSLVITALSDVEYDENEESVTDINKLHNASKPVSPRTFFHKSAVILLD